MRIGIIGGIDRQEPELSRLAAAAGHVLELHTGKVGGRGAGELRALVARVDLLLVVTDHNSHTAVQMARRLGRQLGCPVVVLARCGVARFQALLAALAARERQAMASGTAGPPVHGSR